MPGDEPGLAGLFIAVSGAASESWIEGTLAKMYQSAHDVHPSVKVDAGTFVQHLAERVPRGGDLAAALANVHTADLFLACGCTRGDPAATEAFDREFVSQVSAYLSRRDAMPGFTDELKQVLRERLLVADGGLLPRIAGYTGRGPLGAWVRVAAVREAVDLRHKLAGPKGSVEPESLPAVSDPELDFLRKRYGDVVRAAIGAALRSLEPREATVLRLFFLQGLNLEGIAALYRTSKRSARRWVADARQKIVDETRRELSQHLDASLTQVDSLIRLVQADLEPSLVQFLKNSPKR